MKELLNDLEFNIKVRKQKPSNKDYRNRSNTSHVPKNKYNRKKDKQKWKEDVTND